jgi:hypothetical protein
MVLPKIERRKQVKKREIEALTDEEVAQAMEQSRGSPDRLKTFYALLDDMLWKKNKLKQYKEKADAKTT